VCKDRQSRLLAVEDGILTKVTPYTQIELTSADGQRRWTYLHGHPDDITSLGLQVGSSVKKGDPIGTVSKYMLGTRSTTYHLHIQLRVKDGETWRIVNPYLTLVRAYERRFGVGALVAD